MKLSTLLIATYNEGKVQEIKTLLRMPEVTILYLDNVEAHFKKEFPHTQVPKLNEPIEETEDTFLGNARLKAKAYANAWGYPTLADDSGLCVLGLDHAPGVFSARYAGEGANDQHNIDKLLSTLQQKPQADRTAYFMCVMAFIEPRIEPVFEIHTEGSVYGEITNEQKGTHGFGYDPIFYLPKYEQTFAELGMEEKNTISHRGKAVRAMMDALKKKYT